MRSRPLARVSLACLIVALSIGRGDTALAQQPFVPGLGTVPASAVEVTNEFLLRAPANRIEAIAARHGLTIIRALDTHAHDLYLVRGNAGVSGTPDVRGSDTFLAAGSGAQQEFVNEIQADPEVTDFELNAVAVAPEVPSGIQLNQSPVEILDSLGDLRRVDYFGDQAWVGYVNQRAATAIRVSESHQASGTGAGIVAIIDTGIDPNHPLLAGSLVTGYDFVRDIEGQASEWTDIDPGTAAILDQSPVEILDSAVPLNQSTVGIMNQVTASSLDPSQLPAAFGHGTMVAGVVHLVAPTARIMPLKAFNADGTSRVFDIVRAIYYAVEHGADVINMSFSTTTWSREITHAINFATSHGVVCVSSAGNLGQETVAYPAGLRNVLGVGSTSSFNPPTRSSFTNYGDALVSLGAPGEAIITTYPGGGYAGAWGTSFSTPMVAGAAALLLQVDPALDQIKADSLFQKAERMASAGMGRGRLNLLEVVRSLPDATPPTVAVVTPASGGTLFDRIFVSATASDNVGLVGVRFLLDDNALGEDATAPYELTWNTADVTNGSHLLTAVARDAAGNATTASIGVTVSNDTAAPSVTVTSPASGATVRGSVTIAAAASDEGGEVAGVQFKLDGTALGAEDPVAPYEVAWNTAAVADGTHVLTAVARDSKGNQAITAVSVTVSNDMTAPSVTLTSPAAASSVTGTVTVAATATDDAGVAGVQFQLNGANLGPEDTTAPYELTWDTSTAVNGTHTVTAVARDGAGNQATASSVSVTVANDMAPSVAVTSPAAASSVTGVVTVAATATDDGSVVGVQFKLNGANFWAEDTAAPYERSWNTTNVPNGTYTVAAVARDGAGNVSTASSVSVTVANDTTAPP